MSEVALELYNIHKRATLDRLSAKYSAKAHAIFLKGIQEEAERMEHFLNLEHTFFSPQPGHLEKHLTLTFEDHHDDCIHVGVSDGMQEISPDNQLNAWVNFPINMPIEITLSQELASKRDKIAKQIKTEAKKQQKSKAKTHAQELLEKYLESVKNVYLYLSDEWRKGESTISEVIVGLRQAADKTQVEARRIFRTETTNYFNETRHAYFSQNTLADYIELYAVTDGRISKICEDRHGFVVPMNKAKDGKYMPSFHPNCRTIQRPLISKLQSHQKIIEKGTSMNEASFHPLPPNWLRWRHQ